MQYNLIVWRGCVQNATIELLSIEEINGILSHMIIVLFEYEKKVFSIMSH